jgi:ATP-dependent exoDNAse (exonuclease V) alpha subunit
MLTQHYAMLQRNLLYTGVTRGKRLVVLVGQRKALAIGAPVRMAFKASPYPIGCNFRAFQG